MHRGPYASTRVRTILALVIVIVKKRSTLRGLGGDDAEIRLGANQPLAASTNLVLDVTKIEGMSSPT